METGFPKISVSFSVSFFLTPTQKRGFLFNPRFCNDSDAYTWTVRPCSLFKLPQAAFELVTLVPGLTHDDCRNLEKKLEEVPPSLAAKQKWFRCVPHWVPQPSPMKMGSSTHFGVTPDSETCSETRGAGALKVIARPGKRHFNICFCAKSQCVPGVLCFITNREIQLVVPGVSF